MKKFVEHLLEAPDTQLDASMKPLIEKWSDPPRALEVLEVLDHCIYGSLARGFAVRVLTMMYDLACENEGMNHTEVIKGAAAAREV